MKRNLKLTSLMTSIVAIIVLFAMLIGSTFAWFTDSVTSSNNIIKSGKLDVEMFWAYGKDDPNSDATEWKDASTGAMFDSKVWEPGYTEVRHIKIDNVGTLAFKYKVQIVANGVVSDLADVIDVYYLDPATQITNRSDLNDDNYIGNLTQVLAGMEESAYGELIAGENHTITIALKMRDKAGNEYQDKSIGSDFSIQLYATQLTSESDAFGSNYDADAKYLTPVSTLDAFFEAVDNGDDVYLTDQISVNAETMSFVQRRSANTPSTYSASTFAVGDVTEVVDTDLVLDGNGITVYRTAKLIDKPFFAVDDGFTLTLSNITLDGGARWTGEVNTTLCRGTVNSGLETTASIITLGKASHLVLGEGAIVQNNSGAAALHPNTRVGSTITLNGGEVLNNYSAAGAIWGGGAIIINSGKINYTHGGIGGAIRAVTNIGTLVTMNGGEMNHNYSNSVGGAIWAGESPSSNVYVFNGGEMAYNESPVGGGAMYVGYKETVKIGGTFKLHHNVSPFAPALRFHTDAKFIMTGGEIYENGDNSLFLSNNSTSITGGKISDNFGYNGGVGLTIGVAELDCIIHYNLSTNHNTAYLAKEFSTIKFTVEESDPDFARFNFKPASDYTYTEGDELKLVCLNDGYVTYWDATTNTFRIKVAE